MVEKKPSRRDARSAGSKTGPAPAASASTRTLTARWAAVALALLTLLFFHEVVFGGKTFVSPDAVAPAGFVRIGEQSLWHDHVYPLWNPYVFLGMPSFASGAYNPLIYPPDWPLGLIQKVVPLPDVTWLLLYYFLGGFFLFLLAREWGARAEGALLGAVAFVFAPNLVAVGSHGHGSQLVDSAYLPLMVWLASRWMRRGGLHHLGWLALAGGFQLLRGHVQVCFYTWMAVALYAVVEWAAALHRPDRVTITARAAGVVAAAALAFGIAAFYNLPLRDYSRYSIRGSGEGGGVGMSYATAWSLAPYELLTLVFPGWVGFGDETYWGGMPFTNYPNAYVGMVAVLLAIPAFLPARLRGAEAGASGSASGGNGLTRLFALVLALFALMVSFGHYFPLYGLLYEHLPLFNKFRVPAMALLLVQLSISLATAWGWSALLAPERGGEKARGRSPLDRMLLVAAAVLVGAFLIVKLGESSFRSAYVGFALARHQPFTAELATTAWQGFVSDLGRGCGLGLLALGAAWLARRGRGAALWPSLAALALLLVELWPVSGRVMRPVIGEARLRDLEIGRDDVVDFLEKAGPSGSFRVLPLEEFQSNRLAGFGIATLGGYHAAKPRLFQDLMETEAVRDPRWWRLLNVRFLVVRQPLEPAPEFLHEVYRGSGVVYENLTALPRATVVGAYRVEPNAKAIIDSVRAGGFDSATTTWLESDPRLTLGPVTGARATLRVATLHRVEVEVETPGPALLRLADLWYPDWIATVDDRPVTILRADHALRAVPVPAGRHVVVFRYGSKAVGTGLLVSIVSLLIALAGILGPLAAARARRPAAEEGA